MKNKNTKEDNSIKSIKLKNSQLKGLILFLNIPLHSQKARARNIIYKLVNPFTEEYETERMKLIEKYGSKNKKGELEFIDEEKTEYKIVDKEKFEKSFEKLKNVEIVFDVLPSNKEAWKIVKQIVEDTKVELDITLTDFWEELLESLTIK